LPRACRSVRARRSSATHDLPFADNSFDGVVVQAVLEHVVDRRAAWRRHRVLKGRGVVYAETPFMQQVHMGPYDFTRFTHSGHRRLFRWFRGGRAAPCGPGMALAWAYQHFLLSFATRGLSAVAALASLTAFP
jgi:ubiquinone/menaquinone biosynthesis C-methylase UbiE